MAQVNGRIEAPHGERVKSFDDLQVVYDNNTQEREHKKMSVLTPVFRHSRVDVSKKNQEAMVEPTYCWYRMDSMMRLSRTTPNLKD